MKVEKKRIWQDTVLLYFKVLPCLMHWGKPQKLSLAGNPTYIRTRLIQCTFETLPLQ